MQYILQIFSNGGAAYEALSQDEKDSITGEYMAISQSQGIAGGAQLQPPETATTVRVQDGRSFTNDAATTETKEALGGYFLFDADDLDAAIEIASRIPAARL